MTDTTAERRMLDRDMLNEIHVLMLHARTQTRERQPAQTESKNLTIPAAGKVQAYLDMTHRLDALLVLGRGGHIGRDVLVDVARYARAKYETPITYTRDEQALAYSGRCKAYLDMADRLDALLVDGDPR